MVDTSYIEYFLPKLRGANYRITSDCDDLYNCIAWAAGDTQRWWWPIGASPRDYWPTGVPREETISAFVAAFATLGYSVGNGEDLEDGVEKVALFADPSGVPTHAACQLANGNWMSKLGPMHDIEHSLHDVEGTEYGTVAVILRRARRVP